MTDENVKKLITDLKNKAENMKRAAEEARVHSTSLEVAKLEARRQAYLEAVADIEFYK